MIRIAGINIDEKKRAVVALTAIFGIGPSTSKKILKKASISEDDRLGKLAEQKIENLRTLIEKDQKIEGDLRVEISQNIKRLKEINSYRGVRHAKALPVRGQRTRTNARTKRGRKITVGSGRKKTSEKT